MDTLVLFTSVTPCLREHSVASEGRGEASIVHCMRALSWGSIYLSDSHSKKILRAGVV